MLGDIQETVRKMEAIESKAFTSNEGESRGNRGDPPYAGKSHYVDENTGT